jgi:hypothetical protein
MDSPNPPIPPVITAVRCAIYLPFIRIVDISLRRYAVASGTARHKASCPAETAPSNITP